MDTVSVVLLIVFAAAVGEAINEFFFLPWFDPLKEDPDEVGKSKWGETIRVQLMRLWSGAVGIFIALGLNVCAFSLLGAKFNPPVAGKVLTGLLIGRGSNFIHGLLNKFIAKAKGESIPLIP